MPRMRTSASRSSISCCAAPELAQPYAELTLEMGVERGHPGLRIAGAVLLGWSLAVQGRPDAGLALIEEAVAEDQAIGFQLNQSRNHVMLAEAYLAAGRADAAVAALDRGIAAFARFRDLLCAPDLWTLKGTALLAMGATESEAEECYRTALALAQELGAQTSALRAAVALARLRRSQGESAQGASLLQASTIASPKASRPRSGCGKALLDELHRQCVAPTSSQDFPPSAFHRFPFLPPARTLPERSLCDNIHASIERARCRHFLAPMHRTAHGKNLSVGSHV